MLPFQRVSRVLDPIPLACDPAVAAANDREALLRYQGDGDPSPLVVPPDAQLVTIRSLSDATMDDVARRAGRPSYRGQVIASKIMTELAAVYERLAGRSREEIDVAVAEADAAALDDLTDDDHQRWRDHVAWVARNDFWVAAFGVVAIQGLDYEPVDGIYPLDPLEVLLDEFPAAISEIALHVRRESLLAARGKARSGGRCGAGTSTPAGSPASNVIPSQDCEGSADHVVVQCDGGVRGPSSATA